MKNRIKIVTFLLAVLTGLLVLENSTAKRAHAQSITTPENSSNQTVWYPVSLTSNYLTSYYFRHGEFTTFHGTVYNYDYNTPHTVLISMQIYNSAHERVSEVVYDNVHLEPFSYINIETNSSRNLPPGQYYFSVGIYDPHSLKLLGWFPGYQYFTVAQ